MKTNFSKSQPRSRKAQIFYKALLDFGNAKKGQLESWPLASLHHAEAAEDILSYKPVLQKCLRMLMASPTARLMIKEAMLGGWEVTMEEQGDYDFQLNVPDKLISINNNGLNAGGLLRSQYFSNVVLVSLVRALRDVWQEKRHGELDLAYGIDSYLLVERLRAADCDVIAVLVAWELRSEGTPDLWRYMIGSEDGDMAMAFSAYLERIPSSAFTGTALKVAFQQWFRDEIRVSACDHETLNYLDTILECDEIGQEKISAGRLEIISCLPDRTAYLRGEGQDLLINPLYAGLTDPINQTHYMQILYDLQVTYVQQIPFRDAKLAEKIFPGGEFTKEIQK